MQGLSVVVIMDMGIDDCDIVYLLRTVIGASFPPRNLGHSFKSQLFCEDGDFDIDKWASFGSSGFPFFISHDLVVVATTTLRNHSQKSPRFK